MKGPEGLHPYIFHGLDLSHKAEDKEALADCPLCGKEKKFSISIASSQWGCFVCGESGNQYDFIRKLWQESKEVASETDYEQLSKDRGISVEVLKDWGVVKSYLTGEWMIPGYNAKGNLTQLYRYVKLQDSGKYRLLATPSLPQALHGREFAEPNEKILITEGPWDGMKLDEVLRSYKLKNGKYIKTGGKGALAENYTVYAVPGCQTFNEGWSSLLVNREVGILYDNDHPRKHPKTGKLMKPTAYLGVQKAAEKIGGKASKVSFLKWGPKGYDRELPNGFDVRDCLNEKGLAFLLSRIKEVPDEWRQSAEEKEAKEKQIKPKECTSWKVLTDAWKDRMSWSEGLDTALSVMLACSMSTEMESSPLWIKIIGPPSCGKSTLCEAISVARDWAYPKDKMSSLVSGYKGKDDKNYSAIEKFTNKVIIVKDADTIMSAPNKEEILSQCRGLYDRAFRTEYGNDQGCDFEDVYTSFLLCGTSTLREMDASELGARFLDCVIMHGIDSEHEKMVLKRSIRRAFDTMRGTRNKNKEGGAKSEKEILTMQLTGGYLDHLRKNYGPLTSNISMEEKYEDLLESLSRFVSFMRARPSKRQEDVAEREFSTRLGEQLTKLATCLAVVMGKNAIDKQVMKRVVKVGKDTCIGPTFEICRSLYDLDTEGATQKYICSAANLATARTRNLLRFLKDLGAVEQFTVKTHGITQKPKWRLTEECHKLFEEVLDWEM